MMTPDVIDTGSALKRVPFVNRRLVLDKVEAAMRRVTTSKPAVVLLLGEGGMGKTAVLREILARCHGELLPEKNWYPAEDVIDFYHLDTHSFEGLMAALVHALKPGPQHLVEFQARLADYNKRKWDLAGLPGQASKLKSELTRTLMEELSGMAEGQPLVLAFDTLERLVYERDEVQLPMQVDAKEAGVGVLPWFLDEFLPQLKNAVLLLAARPIGETPPQLVEAIKEATHDRLVSIELKPFELEHAEEYWRTAIANADESGDAATAASLRSIDGDTREIVWRYTDGRPILLSLLMDYLARAHSLWDELKRPVAEVRELSEDELKAACEQLEKQLVLQFQHRGMPVDPAARMLGWARRGLSVELLAELLDVPESEARELHEALETIAFVKKRPDGNLFVHDEMERLLWDHLQQYEYVEQQRILTKIVKWYEKQILAARRALEEELEEASRESTASDQPPKPEEVAEGERRRSLRSKLYTLMAEHVYYALRLKAVDGFRLYYRYIKECYWAGADEAAMECRDELLLFDREFDRWVVEGEGLTRNDILCESALRWLDRSSRLGEHKRVVEMAARLRDDPLLKAAFMEAGDLIEAELDLLEGRARIFSDPNTDRAVELLGVAQKKANLYDPGHDKFMRWRRQMLLAEILNDLGYAARVRGKLDESLTLYSEASLRWREIGPEAEPHQANTLNNLSWALAEKGMSFDALLRCYDGLKLRNRLGQDGPVAFSLNTLGLIEVRNDQPHRGKVHCERALHIFRELAQPRGVGLACTALAEALRRMTLTPEMYDVNQKTQYLKQASAYAQEAVMIFGRDVDERVRLVEALLELGCDYREWARIRVKPRYPQPEDPGQAELVRQSENALRRAVAQAGTDLPHRIIDAQVNLAWLWFYMDEDHKAEQVLGEALKAAAVQPYLPILANPWERGTLDQPAFWAQLGKAHVLKGRLAMRRYKQVAKENSQRYRKWLDLREQGSDAGPEPDLLLDDLKDAAEAFTLALAYNDMYATESRDRRRGLESIYNELRDFNIDVDLPAFEDAMEAARRKHKLRPPTSLQDFVRRSIGSLKSPKTARSW